MRATLAEPVPRASPHAPSQCVRSLSDLTLVSPTENALMRDLMPRRFAVMPTVRLAFVFASLSGLVGCGGSTPEATAPPAGSTPGSAAETATDPDDVPITEADVARPEDYPEALTRIEGYRDTIRDEIAAGRPTKAHRALDELDIVLNWLPEIARDSGVPKEHWEAVNTTAQEIRELFNQVHSRIDAGQDPDYGAVSGSIDQAIGSLQDIPVALSPDQPEATS